MRLASMLACLLYGLLVIVAPALADAAKSEQATFAGGCFWRGGRALTATLRVEG